MREITHWPHPLCTDIAAMTVMREITHWPHPLCTDITALTVMREITHWPHPLCTDIAALTVMREITHWPHPSCTDITAHWPHPLCCSIHTSSLPPATTVHECGLYNSSQNSSNNLPPYPADHLHCWQTVYWKRKGNGNLSECSTDISRCHLILPSQQNCCHSCK